MRRTLLCCLLMLGGKAEILRAEAPAPAPAGPAESRKQADLLEARADQEARKGGFSEALRLSRQALALRRQVQGPRHWQTIDAGLKTERWARLAALPRDRQQQLVEAWRQEQESTAFQRPGQLPQGEKKARAALEIRRKALGEDHPEMASGYYHLAFFLQRQNRNDEALALYKKALAVRTRALGEDHPDTAESCQRVAYCVSWLNKPEKLRYHQQALAIRCKTLGEDHPDTAACYYDVASLLDLQNKPGEALPFFRKAWEVRRKVLSPSDPRIAQSEASVCSCLQAQGRWAEAAELSQQRLERRRRELGEEHADTVRVYHDVANFLNQEAVKLNSAGKPAEALPYYRRVLEVHGKLFGEESAEVATCCDNLGFCLRVLGQLAEALRFHQKALAIHRKVLGEDRVETARSYHLVGFCLHGMGKHGEALPYYEKGLEIRRKILGENSFATAQSYNDVAYCLKYLGRPAEALPLYQKALAIRRSLDAEGIDTARSYYATGSCLTLLDRPVEALPMHQKALKIFRQKLGKEHNNTADVCNRLGVCLQSLGRPAEALSFQKEALAIYRKALGDYHPNTAKAYTDLAACLCELGKREEAIDPLRRALLGIDMGRQLAAPASAGFDRALFAATQQPARPLLACLLARQGKPEEAWQHAEAHLARGLLDSLAGPAVEAEDTNQAALAQLNKRLMPLRKASRLTAAQEETKRSLQAQKDRLVLEIARAAADRLNQQVWSYQQVQKYLPADAALLSWLDVGGEHWGCVLRRQGPPLWERLPGSGPAERWTNEDWKLPDRVHDALRQGLTRAEDLPKRIEQLRKQRLAPLQKHLEAAGSLPAVRHLIVVPAGLMATAPVEVMTPGYRVSYTPSATLFARSAHDFRPPRFDSLVALGDPVFDRQKKTIRAPEYGLLLTQVVPRGNAARAGLRAGDVLLSYKGSRLHSLSDLAPQKGNDPIPGRAWRDGEGFAVRLQPGPLHARFSELPVARALAAWHEIEMPLRGGDESFDRLIGTRLEVEALDRLVGGKGTLLLGSRASEQEIDHLRQTGVLQKARLIHLATHGVIDRQRPEHSALVLARDRLPDPQEQLRRGQKVYDGYLRVSTILREWDLDADLVVLSACETGLGQDGRGEGLLGFAQALIQKKARSVVVARWKVDDTATALLMLRFYENLLGKGDRGKRMGRAEALAEAKQWLAGLDREQALALGGGLVAGEVRGTTRGQVKKLKKPDKSASGVKLPAGERPFSHPTFWAAFVLIGDPD